MAHQFMPDTLQSVKAFPHNQVPWLRLSYRCAIFSIATGAAVAFVINVLSTHDVKLARLSLPIS